MMAKREFSLRTNVEVENDDDHIYGSFFHVSSKLNAPKRMDELRKAKLRHSERYDDFNSRSKNDKYANETIELIKQRKAKDRNKAELSDILARMKINEVDEKHILPNVKVKVDIKTSLIRNNGLPSLVNEPKRTTKIAESRNIRNNFGPYANSKLVISERNRRYFVNIDHSLEDYRLSLNKFKANKPSFLKTKNLLEPSGNTSVHRNQHRMDSRNLEPIVETKLETTQVIGEVKPNAEKETAAESKSKRVVKIKSPIQIIINEAPKEEEEIDESKENEPPKNASRSESSRSASSTDKPRLGLRELIRAELLEENNEKEQNKDQDERVLELEVTENQTEVGKPFENENKEFAQTIDEIQSSNQEARENTDGEQVEGDNDENDEETQQDAEQIEELEEETISNQDDDKDEQKESESISTSHVNRDDNEQANENRIMFTENLEDDEYENGDSSSTEINDNNDEEKANNDNDSDFVIVENDDDENNENEMENVEENTDKPAEDRQEPDYETPEELKGVNVNEEEKAEADEGSKSNYNQSSYQKQENDDNNDVVIPNNDDEEIHPNKSNDDNKNNDLLASDENEVVDKNTEDEATQLRDIIANLNREMAEYRKDLAEEAIEFENRQEILNETSNQETSNPEQIEEIEMEEWQKKETRISVKLELDSRSSKYGFDYRIVQINGHIPIRIPRIYRVDIGLSAHAAGIRDGDFIVKINDTYTSDLSYEEVQSRLYERLNEVELRIRRIDE